LIRRSEAQGRIMSPHFFPWLLAVLSATPPADGDVRQPPFKVTTRRSDDRAEVKSDKDQAVISVHSPTGISNAVLERIGAKWPDVMVLRLYSKGLESFRATSGNVTLDAAISNQGGKVRQWKNGKEDALLNADSPDWIPIRIVGSDGKPATAIPLEDGYFELTLPKVLFDGNPRSITVHWIDFYRN
jgi:hypothetical protein